MLIYVPNISGMGLTTEAQEKPSRCLTVIVARVNEHVSNF